MAGVPEFCGRDLWISRVSLAGLRDLAPWDRMWYCFRNSIAAILPGICGTAIIARRRQSMPSGQGVPRPRSAPDRTPRRTA